MRKIFILFFIPFSLFSSEIPELNEINKCQNATFFLSTTKSGANLISASLSVITRRPISWINWGNKILDPTSEYRSHPSYNRLGLTFISDKPLCYRTHYAFSKLMQVDAHKNRLIFVTRNPKELLYRAYLLKPSSSGNPDPQFIESFLNRYLQAFKVYDQWTAENKRIVFYEDYITQGDEILLKLLKFMDEKPVFFDDFIKYKQEYISKLLTRYMQQHTHNLGGASSIGEPKALFYTKNASMEMLTYIDDYIQKTEPGIWEKYLSRFQSSNGS